MTPSLVSAPFESNYVVSPPNFDMMDMSLHIPTHTNGNSSRLAELESSLLSIQSQRTSMQSDHTRLQNEFQNVRMGVIKHYKEIQAMQSEVLGLTTMMQEIRNAILSNASPLHHSLLLLPS
jgi:chromosome segregation ATPase